MGGWLILTPFSCVSKTTYLICNCRDYNQDHTARFCNSATLTILQDQLLPLVPDLCVRDPRLFSACIPCLLKEGHGSPYSHRTPTRPGATQDRPHTRLNYLEKELRSHSTRPRSRDSHGPKIHQCHLLYQCRDGLPPGQALLTTSSRCKDAPQSDSAWKWPFPDPVPGKLKVATVKPCRENLMWPCHGPFQASTA